MQWSSCLEWSLNCIRMFLRSTLPMRGGRQVQRCVCICENNLQNKFRVAETVSQLRWYEKPRSGHSVTTQ